MQTLDALQFDIIDIFLPTVPVTLREILPRSSSFSLSSNYQNRLQLYYRDPLGIDIYELPIAIRSEEE
jgi:hypothetical protein